jgi:hypothetical protein
MRLYILVFLLAAGLTVGWYVFQRPYDPKLVTVMPKPEDYAVRKATELELPVWSRRSTATATADVMYPNEGPYYVIHR